MIVNCELKVTGSNVVVAYFSLVTVHYFVVSEER